MTKASPRRACIDTSQKPMTTKEEDSEERKQSGGNNNLEQYIRYARDAPKIG